MDQLAHSEVDLTDPLVFSSALYEKMQLLSPGVAELELDEFRYCLENLVPSDGWQTIELESMERIEQKVNNRWFYESIQLRPHRGGRPVMDETILGLQRMLMVGLVSGGYPVEWIARHFYYDLRGSFFLHRTEYTTPEIINRLGGRPLRGFEPKQRELERAPAVGYKAFKEANREIDECFIALLRKLVDLKGIPVLVAIAGQTAAGKTEIVARLQSSFADAGRRVTSIELDNFFTDRDEREARGIDSLGKEALHYELLQQCLKDIRAGETIYTPRYDFITATSSHNGDGKLRQGRAPVEIQPADIIFIEGNFPFLLPEIAPLIGIKVVYLTGDDVRLKRKWRRDMDLRRKYELTYFLNRYFREQFLMAESAYTPQMLLCDLLVDTTQAEIWATSEITAAMDEICL